MALLESKQKNFFDLKKEMDMRVGKAVTTQDVVEIERISKSGIFQVLPKYYTRTYQMTDMNYESLSYEDQVIFFSEWVKILDSFSVSFKVTVVNQRRNKKLVSERILYQMKGNEYDEVREAYNDIIRNKIYVNKKGIEQLKYLTIKTKQDTFEEAKRFFEMSEACIAANFSKIGIELRPLSGSERLYPLHCLYRYGEEEKYDLDIDECIQARRDWRNDIAPDCIKFSKDKFEIRNNSSSGTLYGRAMYIDPHSYGSSFEDKFFDNMISTDTCGVFTIDYEPIPKDWLKTTLENKYMAIEGKISKQQQKRNKQKNFMSDITYNVRMEKEEIEALLNEARTDNAKMLWVGITAVVTAETEADLEKHTTSLQKECANNSCVMKPFNNMQRNGLNSSLPIGVRNHTHMRAMYTRMAAGFIPFKVREAMDFKEPFYYGANKVSGNPILMNRKHLMNPNGFVFGKSGSGKSFTGAKMEIGSVFINTNDDIIIVDPQNEFGDVVEMCNGTYINLDTKAQTHVNPLHIKVTDLSSKKKLDEIIREKTSVMNSIAEQSNDSDDEIFGLSSIIGRCVRLLYSDIAALPETERYVPIMTDMYKYIEKQVEEERRKGNDIKAEASEKLSITMERFVDGSLDIYNHQTNIDPKNRVVAYGMRDLGKDLWAVSISIMLSAIQNRVYENFKIGKATWIYIDEFHYMAKTPYSRTYTIEAYKTYRKFGGIVTGLTQNVSDVLKDDDLATLIANSEYTLFMAQSPKDTDKILEAFEGITYEQLKYVRNAEKGTGLIRFGDTTYVPMDNRMEKTIPLYAIFTTDMHEREAMKRAGGEVHA